VSTAERAMAIKATTRKAYSITYNKKKPTALHVAISSPDSAANKKEIAPREHADKRPLSLTYWKARREQQLL
jgi:hypothetical protein